MAVVTIRQLLDSGVHFGHQTRRWNPKVKRFILTERSGIHIIDLQQSLGYIDKAYEYVRRPSPTAARSCSSAPRSRRRKSSPSRRRASGSPTSTSAGSVASHQLPDGVEAARAHEGARGARLRQPRRLGLHQEGALLKKRELDKLHKSLGGIRNLQKTPSAIWVVDAKREHLAIDEAKKLGIPVIGILDTNADPDEFQFPIPGNDDAIRSVGLLTRIIADAAAEGLIQRHNPTDEAADAEPLADWERELLEAPAAEVVTDVAEVETIATESAADEAGAEAKAEGDAAATAE
jgi:small subunit ribosomal protein S2